MQIALAANSQCNQSYIVWLKKIAIYHDMVVHCNENRNAYRVVFASSESVFIELTGGRIKRIKIISGHMHEVFMPSSSCSTSLRAVMWSVTL